MYFVLHIEKEKNSEIKNEISFSKKLILHGTFYSPNKYENIRKPRCLPYQTYKKVKRLSKLLYTPLKVDLQ